MFEILPLIIFVHRAGGMQTRGTPSTPALIWSLTNDIAPEAYLRGRHCGKASPFLTLPFREKEQMVPSDLNTPASFDGFCSLWLGSNPGGWEWDEERQR